MPKKEIKKLSFWLEQFAEDTLIIEGKNEIHTLACAESITRAYAFLEDIGIFINTHGEAHEGEVNCTSDCETEMDSYIVQNKKIARARYFYNELEKTPTSALEIYEEYESITNNSTETNVDEFLVSRIYEEWEDPEGLDKVFAEILEFVSQTGGRLEIFVHGAKVLFTPEGLFLAESVPGEPVELGLILAEEMGARKVDYLLAEMSFSDFDHEHAKIRKNGFYLPMGKEYHFANLELKTTDNTWATACSLCTKRLKSAVEDGCNICKIDFIDSSQTEDLRTYFASKATR